MQTETGLIIDTMHDDGGTTHAVMDSESELGKLEAVIAGPRS